MFSKVFFCGKIVLKRFCDPRGEIMKKKLAIICCFIILFFVVAFLWWNTPTTFLKSTEAGEIHSIQVRNGHNGNMYEISNPDDIQYIVNNIQSQSFEKEGVSLFRMGTWFTLTFCDKEGKIITKFILNSDDTIRKDPLFYKTDEEALQNIINYLNEMEKTMDSK